MCVSLSAFTKPERPSRILLLKSLKGGCKTLLDFSFNLGAWKLEETLGNLL